MFFCNGGLCRFECLSTSGSLQKQLCTFNDDIQGTAAIATRPCSRDQRYRRTLEHRKSLYSLRTAGIGITTLLMQFMQEKGLSEQEARKRIYAIDATV